jgi:4-hydroxy-2-oxoheptanedioate aldolase
MNNLELKMIEILKDLKENHHAIGVKAEFEDEGTRQEEAMRLKEIVMEAGLDLTIKIGGCAALRDMYDTQTIGVSRIVAPMVESQYALKKFLATVKLVYPHEKHKTVELFINIETINACNNINQILAIQEISELKGIVIGRVDLVGSMGLSRKDINSPEIAEIVNKVLIKAKQESLKCTIGGGASDDALPFLRGIASELLDGFETRKVLFKCPEALEAGAEIGIQKAVEFELFWLENKKEYYDTISNEDAQRITMLKSRKG